jgi:K+-sensing histidine kinase KdpD
MWYQNQKKAKTLKFSVKDTGVVQLANKDKIFNSFVQRIIQPIENLRNRLGLAISNQLLALMDSKLQLISKYGDGSDFFLRN